MLRAVKVRIYPNSEQTIFLNQQFGAVRMVYNKGLAIIRNQYKRHNKSLKAIRDIKPLLAIAKKSRKYNWLNNYDSIALQESCRNLDFAFTKFFQKKSRYPKFKKKQGSQSSYHCTAIFCGDNWIKIPKLKSKIKAKMHRLVPENIKSITISKTSIGKYYASILYDTKEPKATLPKDLKLGKVIGLDVGVTNLINDSNGKKIANPRYLNKASKNLRRKHKNLSRKVKGSAKRAKARELLAKCHEKLANSRNDLQHKVTKTLIDENQAIVVETLQVKNMLKNRKLSKHIADCAWGMLLTKLEYKCSQYGKHYVKINQWFASSKTCSHCGYKMDKLPLSIRQWVCSECGIQHDRDLNAAFNIKAQGILKLKAAGLSVSASGGLRKTDISSAVA